MANESSSDLDSRIASIVDSTVGSMRHELLQRLQDTESRLRDLTGRLGLEGTAAEAPEPTVAPAPQAPPGEVGVSDLFDALAAIDRGASQQEVLAALLEGTGRFASRSALFLTRADSAQGWGSYGFEETAGEIQDVVLSYSQGPLAGLAEGRGCVLLNAGECGAICRQLGVAPGAEGLLVPFVLRDRVAAALYADRLTDDPPLAVKPLQLLAYVGAQAVEGLALRKRNVTPTLQIAAEEATEPGVTLWEGPTAEPQTAPEAEAAPPAVQEPSAVEAAPEPAAPVAPPPVIAAPPPSEVVEEEAPAEMPTEALPPIEEDLEPVDGSEWTPQAEPPAETEPQEVLEEPTEELPPLEAAPAPAAVEAAEEPQPWADTGDDTLTAEEPEPEPEPEAAPVDVMAPATEPAADSAAESTEVSPPTDVSGPGWAFTASRAAAESGDDAQHEEARRLARLLVTEIKLYNEEQVEEGRRGNDIYARLREDIDRSRQIFDERVDAAVREENDYFQEEMVRILAAGNPEALGL